MDLTFDYFKKPIKSALYDFFNFHLQQPYQGVTFNPMKAYFRRENGVIFKRQWLTYYQQKIVFIAHSV